MFYIRKQPWKKVIQYANAAYNEWQSEISGMLIAEKDEDGDWEIHSPVILEQMVSGGNTSLNKEELAKYYTKMGKKHSDSDIKFVWWHSHHTMGAFWSGTDISSIDEYGEGESDLSFALVVNLKEEYKCRVSVWKPVEIHQDVELNILSNEEKVEIPSEILSEVKEKCETRSIISTGYSKTQNGNTTLPLWDNTRNNWASYKMLEDDCMKPTVPSRQQIANFEARYEYAIEKSEEFLRQVTLGDWNMHKFKKAIRETNKQITEYGVEIRELNKDELRIFLELDYMPYELVDCEDKFSSIAEAINELHDYNGGYLV